MYIMATLKIHTDLGLWSFIAVINSFNSYNANGYHNTKHEIYTAKINFETPLKKGAYWVL